MNRREAMAAMGAVLLPMSANGRQIPKPAPCWESWDEVCEQLTRWELAANRQSHPGEQRHYTQAIRWSPGVMIGYGAGSQLDCAVDATLLLRWTDQAGLVLLGQWGADDNRAWAVAIYTPSEADQRAVREAWGQES